MQRLSEFVGTTSGFTLFLTLIIAVYMLALGLGPDRLPFPPQSPYSDAVISHWPNALYLQENVRAGQFPAWRDLLMSGQPFAANPLNKVWYPFQWLAVILPPTVHLNLLIWLHLLLAGVGFRLFSLRLGMRVGTANIMGLAYAFAPRLSAAIGAGHLDIVYAAAWIPWVLWAINRLIRSEHLLLQSVVWFGVTCALCFLADLRICLLCAALGLGYGVWLWSGLEPSRKRRTLALGLAGIVLALGLTAVQWLTLLPLTSSLSRSGLTVQDAAVFSLQPVQLIGLVTADRSGFHETMVYVGIIVLLLAVVGFWRSLRKQWFWAGVIVIGGLYALGDHAPLWPFLVRIAPPLLWLRVPSRAWIVVIVALIVMAGYGLEALLDRGMQRRLARPAVALIGIGIAGGFVFMSLPLRPGAGLTAATGMIALAVLMLLSPRLSARVVTVAVALLIVFDLVWMNVTLIDARPDSQWLGQYTELGQALTDAHITRLYSPDYSLPQQVAAYWHIPQFGGVDPFQLKAYVAAFEATTGTHATGYSVTLPAYDNGDLATANRGAQIDAAQLARWNVSHVLSGFPIENPDLQLISRISERYLYMNLKWSPDVTIKWDGPDRFTATNQSTQPINVAAWAPGWDVAANGPAITVAPGETLTATYTPPNLSIALLISSVALIATLVATSVAAFAMLVPRKRDE